ncbi:Antibiotic biosynthesis monooxygenase [Rhodobacteraceae bacterium THAF1]|uniref:putative quinol monooxygenase n=1 Tax=Palleronia sp. THAF1 TaxID=2587842 RepID=UPI000F401B4A|nr:putative quinol monooxygenase [Palleronia sp. THAF1]QFU08971.1 Antibiotic biosynthesis monooxygenase [Palleronia sp. THAF1]VDC24290.1 Antibiotic biosynthesis monooxygenase [Rhodobacteraceae bacterium THAF1]
MPELSVNGRLICRTEAEADAVRIHLPDHIAATRNEPGCLSFEITQTDDPLVWAIAERFTDRAAFQAHQDRTATTEWARATAGIPRDMTIGGE